MEGERERGKKGRRIEGGEEVMEKKDILFV